MPGRRKEEGQSAALTVPGISLPPAPLPPTNEVEDEEEEEEEDASYVFLSCESHLADVLFLWPGFLTVARWPGCRAAKNHRFRTTEITERPSEDRPGLAPENHRAPQDPSPARSRCNL